VSSPLDQVVSQINKICPVDIEDYDDSGEWFSLESEDLYDDQVYSALIGKWQRIVGPHMRKFALIYCESEPESGLWLHYLSTEDMQNEYACGCYWLKSWA